MQTLVRSSKWLAAILSADGSIVSLSQSAEQFAGYFAGELVGKPITRILADDTAFEIPKILNAAKEWGNWEGEIVHCTRSGKVLEARGVVASLSGKGDLPEGFLLVSSLSNPPSMAECDGPVVADIAANLRAFAHDLNNPLAVIMGFAQLLVLDSDCNGKARADLDKLYAELQVLAGMVDKLHRYATSLQQKKPSGQAEK